MNEIASERARIDPFRQVIRESHKHAFSKRFGIVFVDSLRFGESFGSSDLTELFEQLRYLLRYSVTDAEPAGFVRAMFLRVEPRANQDKEIRFRFFSEKELSIVFHLAVLAPLEQMTLLSERGYQSHCRNAPQLVGD
jgi:hypothetical protein